MEVPFDESLRARTIAAIALIRELSAREVAPEPLPAELRHRCFGCSLAPICLPEETLYLIHQPAPEPGPDGTLPEEPPEPLPPFFWKTIVPVVVGLVVCGVQVMLLPETQ